MDVTAEDIMQRGLEARHIMGNECADALAKRGARMAEIDEGTRQKLRAVERKAAMVRRRLVCIQKHVVEKWAEEGREEEEKKRRRAHRVRAARLKAEKRKRSEADEECVVERSLRLRRKTAEGERGWRPPSGDEERRQPRREGVFERVLREWKERKEQKQRRLGICTGASSEGC